MRFVHMQDHLVELLLVSETLSHTLVLTDGHYDAVEGSPSELELEAQVVAFQHSKREFEPFGRRVVVQQDLVISAYRHLLDLFRFGQVD